MQIYNNMDSNAIQRIISSERLSPYLVFHNGNLNNAFAHYKANIEISEALYPLLAILEIGLRNNIDRQLQRMFYDKNWFNQHDFIREISSFQMDKISDARKLILRDKDIVLPGAMVAELSFGFWTSLLDVRFERIFWKNLRHAFPNCPKHLRQRRTMSTKFNGIRKLRNRVFHHESISWNVAALIKYRNEIFEGIDWLDKDLLEWSHDLFRIDEIINYNRKIILKND